MSPRPAWRARLGELLREHSIQTGEFVLASGETSNVYVDVRRTALLGEGAFLIGTAFLEAIDRHCPDVEAVGGLTLGADPLVVGTAVAAHVLEHTPVEAIIVRKQAKDHGTGRAVELPGTVFAGARVAVVDDTMTSGGSTVRAVEALRAAGLVVDHALCVVDRQAGASRALADVGVVLHSMFTLDELV